jgi:hypothetical protein
MLTDSLIRRTMKRTDLFVDAHQVAAPPGECPPLKPPGETLVGWYPNPPPRQGTVLWFTTAAIYVVSAEARTRVAFREVMAWQTKEPKGGVTGVSVELTDGQECFIPCSGTRGPGGKFKDAFDLATMLSVIVGASRDALPES